MQQPRSTGLRLMAVHAHPDDESSKGAATTAKYVGQGVDVMVVSCTGGERGDILNDKLRHDPQITRDLTQVRRQEMAQAAQLLGVRHTWLGFVDSGLPEGDPLPPLPDGCFAVEPLEVTTEALVRVIRSFRPHVLTTYDENGGYPHPDHQMTHTVSIAAFQAAGDPTAYPQAGAPWQPQKLYYNGWSALRMRALHEAMVSEGIESPYADWIKAMESWPQRTVLTHIACADYFEQRDDALRAHATQVDPEGSWFQVPLEMQQRVHPQEDFELARSLVPVDLPEDDLFAGLRALDLDQVCRRVPERAADGEWKVAYRGPLPRPAEAPAEPAERRAGDSQIDEVEGHHDEEAAS